MSIALVTDSTADIPDKHLRIYNIHVVPNLVIVDGTSLVDGVNLSRQEFYERLPDMASQPTTSTASSGTYQELYENLLSQGANHIISIHASSLLSGIYNAAYTAAQQVGERVKVIDSEQLTLGLGYQVLAAAESIANNETLDRVLETVYDVRQRARVIAMLDTLEYVRRSGRVSSSCARLGNLLRIKPFVEVRKGQVLSLGETRTRRKGIERLKGFLLSMGSIERLAILHTNAEEDALKFLSDLNLELNYEPFIVNVNTVIGVHVGPNGLGFATVVK